jgi:hypothetical protein
MAGHLARNQVHAGSIPAALTTRVSAPGRAVGLQSRRTAFESLLTRNADRMASVTLKLVSAEVSHLVRVLEGAAEWPATGPENPGRGTEPERLPAATSRHRGFAAMYRSVRFLRLPLLEWPSGRVERRWTANPESESSILSSASLPSPHRCPSG